jgi:hypothetical protein
MFHENKFMERSMKRGKRYVPRKPIQGTIHEDVQGTTHINGLDWARVGGKVDRMI